MRFLAFLILLLGVPNTRITAQTQLIPISGKITYYDVDCECNRPVVNVEVRIDNSQQVTSTDQNGDYVLYVPPPGPFQVTVGVYFRNELIEVKGRNNTRSTFLPLTRSITPPHCPDPTRPCSFSLSPYESGDIDLSEGTYSTFNEVAKIFMMADLTARFTRDIIGSNPPKLNVIYPMETNLAVLLGEKYDLTGKKITAFFWPFGSEILNSRDFLQAISGLTYGSETFYAFFPWVLGVDAAFQFHVKENTIYIPEETAFKYPGRPEEPSGRTTVFHEYGHFLMKHLRGGTWPISKSEYVLGFAKIGDESPTHSWDKFPQTPRQAFIEGWANFYGSAVESQYDFKPNIPNVSSTYGQLSENPYSGNYSRRGGSYPRGFELPYLIYTGNPSYYVYNRITDGYTHEVTVGSAFFDLYDPYPSIDFDNFQITKNNLLDLIREQPNTFEDYVNRLYAKPYLDGVSRGNLQTVLSLNKMAFTFQVQPLIASFSGPSELAINQVGTWRVTPSGGLPAYQYQWFYQYPCDSFIAGDDRNPKKDRKKDKGGVSPTLIPSCRWFELFPTNPNTMTRSDRQDFELRSVASDALGNSREQYWYVSVGEGSGPTYAMKESTATSEASESGQQMAESNWEGQEVDESSPTPKEFTLYGNTPNPFNPTTEIRFNLPETMMTTLAIYDLLGKEVARLVDGSLTAGEHRIVWQAAGMPSGMYLYRLSAGSQVQVKRMTLQR